MREALHGGFPGAHTAATLSSEFLGLLLGDGQMSGFGERLQSYPSAAFNVEILITMSREGMVQMGMLITTASFEATHTGPEQRNLP